jgi:hypothetical protein
LWQLLSSSFGMSPSEMSGEPVLLNPVPRSIDWSVRAQCL